MNGKIKKIIILIVEDKKGKKTAIEVPNDIYIEFDEINKKWEITEK